MNISSETSIMDLLKEEAPKIEKSLEEFLAKTYSESEVTFAMGNPRFAYDTLSLTESIAKPIWHCLGSGGKRWRPVLSMLFGDSLGADPELMREIVILVETIHNGTLLADDVEDDSPMRRGVPAVHIVFGVDIAVNASSMMYFLPLQVLLKNRKGLPEETRLAIYDVYAEEMIRLHAGQGLDIIWHKGFRVPSTEEYLQMCAYKTGTLARMGVRFAAEIAGANKEIADAVGRFAESVGVGFQIQDDILNVTRSELSKGKGFGEDIHEGKMTLIVLHSLANAGEEKSARLKEILDLHTEDEALIIEAVEILESTDSISYAATRASQLVREAWEEVEPYLNEGLAKDKINEFAQFLIERNV